MFLSSPCETSSNGIHFNTRRVIRELIAHLMVELPINTIKKKNKKTWRCFCLHHVKPQVTVYISTHVE